MLRASRFGLRWGGIAGRFGRQSMKLAALAVWLLTGVALATPAPPAVPERTSIEGREYVRLTDWAQARNFQLAWLSKQDLVLSNKTTRLGFTVNSQKASLNGVNVYLAAPVALHQNAPWIGSVDLKTTLQPLLWPTRPPKARLGLICLDPGHGGKDTGKRDGKRLEKEYTLSLARELASHLRKAGYKVFLTRSWDTYVELDERAEIARQRGADLFISLHFNAAPSPDARGVEVYCMTAPHTASTNARGEGAGTGSLPGNLQNDGNILLAYQLQRSITSRLGLEDRGVRRARWAVLANARMPAVLLEGGFMSNPEEARKIYTTAWRRQLAEAVAQAVASYQLAVCPAVAKPARRR